MVSSSAAAAAAAAWNRVISAATSMASMWRDTGSRTGSISTHGPLAIPTDAGVPDNVWQLMVPRRRPAPPPDRCRSALAAPRSIVPRHHLRRRANSMASCDTGSQDAKDALGVSLGPVSGQVLKANVGVELGRGTNEYRRRTRMKSGRIADFEFDGCHWISRSAASTLAPSWTMAVRARVTASESLACQMFRPIATPAHPATTTA